MADVVKLRNWEVIIIGESSPALVGEAYGHTRYEDGERIRTAPVEDVIGDRIMTRGGAVFLLDGAPDPGYLSRYLGSNRDRSSPLTAACDRAIARSNVII